MYHPYFRGKQFELLTIRETAELLAKAGFVPIIEPVREALRGLQRALDAVMEADGEAVVIVNPDCGDHSENGEDITMLLSEQYVNFQKIHAGILLKNGMTLDDAMVMFDAHSAHDPVLIHAGFDEPKALAEKLGERNAHVSHVFLEKFCGIPYRKHFKDQRRILIRDGFKKRRNADHPPVEVFSDLHVTYEEAGMDGFGDFLVVGDDYSESGGPAYAVAIHITYIDESKDDVMYIHHFVSDSRETPTDPAGKFAEALRDLVAALESAESKILETDAIREFRRLHANAHFPGLGYIKKLSMKHHIELMADFFDE